MLSRIHAAAGLLAMLLVALFFASSLATEVAGDVQSVVWVKQAIVYGLGLLVPAMLVAGLSGQVIAGKRKGRLIQTKLKRTVAAALCGLLILTPSAIVLHQLAAAGAFGATFYMVQGLEFVAGAVNLVLIGLNVRDGFRLTGRFPNKRRQAALRAGADQTQ